MPTKEEILLNQRTIALEKELERVKNKTALFEKIIDIAEEKYGLEIRNNPEAKKYLSLIEELEKKQKL